MPINQEASIRMSRGIEENASIMKLSITFGMEQKRWTAITYLHFLCTDLPTCMSARRKTSKLAILVNKAPSVLDCL